MRVVPMRTKRGNPASNQNLVTDSEGEHFFSYGSKIASKRFGTPHVTLYDPFWDNFSKTTNNYLLQFLDENSIKDIRKKVISGEYLVA